MRDIIFIMGIGACSKCDSVNVELSNWKALFPNQKDREVCSSCYSELQDYYSKRLEYLAQPIWKRAVKQFGTGLIYLLAVVLILAVYQFISGTNLPLINF